ncbi:helix-turn-helix transcriptional regulator [Streptomyces sp. IB2014 011-1]|uniref:helix-turn-helix domain-containing protein n=1 Tax=Streptomyces sp. IB2014 011-1 TaxID=1844478 RepID=UPI0009CC807F|nr:helix-turn-helix transcriptional regulator [Streptomyces sp. IB2014 011-1]ONI48533.1 helix-turn-helix protein [Streptomyces sp. IB2014 011-1]
MGKSVGPAGRMQIGRVLSTLRERAGLTQAQAATAAGVSIGTVNRYEGWQDRASLRIPTVRAIAEACGATAEERDALVRLASTQEEGWWLETPALPDVLSPLVSFEKYATYEHVWAESLVPGLLQTPAYALALHESARPRADADTVQANVDARIKRQSVLDGGGLHLWVVLKESVLQDEIGGHAVMAEQLGHLIDISRKPHITLQVLPRSVGHVAGGGHFLLLGREDADPMASMAVVYLELHKRGMYLDAPPDVQEYKIVFDYLRSEAVDTETSRTLLDQARQEHAR